MKCLALVALVAGCAGATPPVVLTGRAPATSSFPGRVTVQLAAYYGPSSVCDPSDSANLCSAANVIARVGHILDGVRRAPCSDAARALDRYADFHAPEIATLLHLHELEPAGVLARWEDRHRGTAELALVAGFDLVTRCEHDDNVERAVRRVGLGAVLSRSTAR